MPMRVYSLKIFFSRFENLLRNCYNLFTIYKIFMKKISLLVVLALGAGLAGCSSSSKLEIENRELRRQIDTLKSRQEFLQSEIQRLSAQTPATEQKNAPVEPQYRVCGGPTNFLCPDGFVCLDKGPEPDATGKCVAIDKVREYRQAQRQTEPTAKPLPKDIPAATSECGVLGEIVGADRDCCENLQKKKMTTGEFFCAAVMFETTPEAAPKTEIPAPEPEPIPKPEPKPAPAPEPQNYQVKGLTTYQSQRAGFSIKYPSYWYYGGYGAQDGALWVAGFAPEELDDEGTKIVIRAELHAGTAPQNSKNSQQLSADRWVQVSGPAQLQDTLSKMAKSAQLLD